MSHYPLQHRRHPLHHHRRRQTDQHTRTGQGEHRHPHRPPGLVRAQASLPARLAEEDDAERLREARRRQPADQREPGDDAERGDGAAAAERTSTPSKRAEVDQELARRTRSAAAARRWPRRRPGRSPRSTASASSSPPRWSISRVPVACEHGARAEEEQPLEQGVVEDVQRERRRSRAPPARASRRSVPTTPTPSPSAMMPMFSTLWYASSRLRSCCASANSTPSTPEVSPMRA